MVAKNTLLEDLLGRERNQEVRYAVRGAGAKSAAGHYELALCSAGLYDMGAWAFFCCLFLFNVYVFFWDTESEEERLLLSLRGH